MKGTEALLPSGDLDSAVAAGSLRVGSREFTLQALKGHTASDLVLADRASGVVFAGGLANTRNYLVWLDQAFGRWAVEGLEMNEVLRAPVPPAFKGWAAFATEYVPNVAHLYPRYEKAVLRRR